MNELITPKQGSGVLGVEGLGGRHLPIANIVLVQATSGHFTDKGILPGRIVNSLNDTPLTDTSFVPAFMTEKLFVYKYLDEACRNKQFDFVATDEFDKRLDGRRTTWEDGKKPEVIPTIILAAIMGGKPVKVSFRGTSGYPAGRKLWGFVYEAANDDHKALWGVKYRLLATKRTNKNGESYYAYDIEKVGDPSEFESQQASVLYDAFKTQVELTTPD